MDFSKHIDTISMELSTLYFMGSQVEISWDSVVVMFCCALLCIHSSFAIILMGKRELVALLSLSSWCLVIVVLLFLMVT